MDMKLKAGLAFLAFAAVIMIGPSLFGGTKPMPGTCETSAVGVSLIANSIKQGSTTAVIMTAGGGLLANAACKALVENLEKDPAEEQPIRVMTPEGGVIEEQITREDLIRQPPAAPEYVSTVPGTADTYSEVGDGLGGLSRTLDCISSYDVALLRQWCFDGEIEPLAE